MRLNKLNLGLKEIYKLAKLIAKLFQVQQHQRKEHFPP